MDVVTADDGDIVVVRPQGDVDAATCPALRESLEAIDRDVVVDLWGVPFMDSTGLGILAMQRRPVIQVPYATNFPDNVVPPAVPCTNCPSSGAIVPTGA